ncbi:MAG: hypothetical protein GW949_08145 [Spirochaetales bacterium]|nr:hypothetical protein [Spirochaetales bacterium]
MEHKTHVGFRSFYFLLVSGALLFFSLLYGAFLTIDYLQQIDDLQNQFRDLGIGLNSSEPDLSHRLIVFQELDFLLNSQELLRRGRTYLPEIEPYLSQASILLANPDRLSETPEHDEGLFRFFFSSLEALRRSARRGLDLFLGQIGIVGLLFLVILVYAVSRSDYERRKRRWDKEVLEDMLNREEDLRRLLSSELHDDIAQTLALARISGLDESRRLLGLAIRGIRSLTRNLSVPSLSDEELGFRLQELADSYRQTGDFELQFRISGSLADLNRRSLGVNLFRIVQELLQNAHRHSNATLVILTIHRGAKNLSVRYRDDGRGFDLPQSQESPKRATLGLRNLRDRVSLFDGTLRIEAARGKGTQVELDIPLSQ